MGEHLPAFAEGGYKGEVVGVAHGETALKTVLNSL